MSKSNVIPIKRFRQRKASNKAGIFPTDMRSILKKVMSNEYETKPYLLRVYVYLNKKLLELYVARGGLNEMRRLRKQIRLEGFQSRRFSRNVSFRFAIDSPPEDIRKR